MALIHSEWAPEPRNLMLALEKMLASDRCRADDRLDTSSSADSRTAQRPVVRRPEPVRCTGFLRMPVCGPRRALAVGAASEHTRDDHDAADRRRDRRGLQRPARRVGVRLRASLVRRRARRLAPERLVRSSHIPPQRRADDRASELDALIADASPPAAGRVLTATTSRPSSCCRRIPAPRRTSMPPTSAMRRRSRAAAPLDVIPPLRRGPPPPLSTREHGAPQGVR